MHCEEKRFLKIPAFVELTFNLENTNHNRCVNYVVWGRVRSAVKERTKEKLGRGKGVKLIFFFRRTHFFFVLLDW